MKMTPNDSLESIFMTISSLIHLCQIPKQKYYYGLWFGFIPFSDVVVFVFSFVVVVTVVDIVGRSISFCLIVSVRDEKLFQFASCS